MEEAAKAAVSVKAFSDEEFKKAARELPNPDLEGYEFFLESSNIKFYRRYREVSSGQLIASGCDAPDPWTSLASNLMAKLASDCFLPFGHSLQSTFRPAFLSLLSAIVCYLSFFYQDTKLYEYKIFGVQEDLDPELSAQVYMDWEYRKKWDSYVLGEPEQQTKTGKMVEGWDRGDNLLLGSEC